MTTPYCEASIATLDPAAADGRGTRKVRIFDARSDAPDFATAGFELVSLPTAVTDWYSDSGAAPYYEEVASFAQARTGCDWVLFYPLLVRDPALAGADADRNPIEIAHSDYSERYLEMLRTPGHPYLDVIAPSMRRAGVTQDDIRRATRLLTLQLWRVIGAGNVDYPLCFGDASTFAREDFVPVQVEEYGGVRTEFESLLVIGNEHQRWYTYPDMTPDEVVVFRAYDSERIASGEPFWTPHCAFRDPVVRDPVPRRSVEMRAICGYAG